MLEASYIPKSSQPFTLMFLAAIVEILSFCTFHAFTVFITLSYVEIKICLLSSLLFRMKNKAALTNIGAVAATPGVATARSEEGFTLTILKLKKERES